MTICDKRGSSFWLVQSFSDQSGTTKSIGRVLHFCIYFHMVEVQNMMHDGLRGSPLQWWLLLRCAWFSTLSFWQWLQHERCHDYDRHCPRGHIVRIYNPSKFIRRILQPSLTYSAMPTSVLADSIIGETALMHSTDRGTIFPWLSICIYDILGLIRTLWAPSV